jgi:uncharacterized membrane protein (DUF373 family)
MNLASDRCSGGPVPVPGHWSVTIIKGDETHTYERRSGKPGKSGKRDAELDDDRSRLTQVGERLLRTAEDVVYVAVAALLVVGALVLLVDAAGELGGIGDGADSAVLGLLDRLLLVFVLVELIFAVRMTLNRREIVAEPFLIVGIIASIKEIILLSVEAANVLEGKATTDGSKDPQEFALLIALLGLLVVVLASSAVLLRLKERQPVEGKRNEEHREDDEEPAGS